MNFPFKQAGFLALAPLLALASTPLEAGNRPSRKGAVVTTTVGFMGVLVSGQAAAVAGALPAAGLTVPKVAGPALPGGAGSPRIPLPYALETLLAAKAAGILLDPPKPALKDDAPAPVAAAPAQPALPAALERLLARANQTYPAAECLGKTWQGPWEYPPACRPDAIPGTPGPDAAVGTGAVDAATQQVLQFEECVCRTLETHPASGRREWEADLLADLRSLKPMCRNLAANLKQYQKAHKALKDQAKKDPGLWRVPDAQAEGGTVRLSDQLERQEAAGRLVAAALEKYEEVITPLMKELKQAIARRPAPKEEEHIQSTWTAKPGKHGKSAGKPRP